MRGRTLLILLSLLALAVVAPGIAVAKRGGTDRPWKATGTGTTTLDIVTGTGTTVGASHITHLGKTTTSQTIALTPTANPNTFGTAGTATFTAANGDLLFTSFTGTLTSTGPQVGGTAEFTLVQTVTGGTGRFADASGSFTTTGSSVIVSIVGTTVTSNQTFTSEGTISY